MNGKTFGGRKKFLFVYEKSIKSSLTKVTIPGLRHNTCFHFSWKASAWSWRMLANAGNYSSSLTHTMNHSHHEYHQGGQAGVPQSSWPQTILSMTALNNPRERLRVTPLPGSHHSSHYHLFSRHEDISQQQLQATSEAGKPLTKLLLSITRWRRMMKRAAVFRGFPNVKMSMSEPW